MILYRLRCSKGHEFDSWFKDSKTYERQEKKSLVGCAVCGDSKVARAMMAPRIGKKGNRRREAVEVAAPADAARRAHRRTSSRWRRLPGKMPKELREALLKVRAEVEKNCEHVGDKFAEEARKIHYGESDKRGIYGETSDEEAEALAEEGIEFGRLPVGISPRGNSAACISGSSAFGAAAPFRLSRLPPRISAAPSGGEAGRCARRRPASRSARRAARAGNPSARRPSHRHASSARVMQ